LDKKTLCLSHQPIDLIEANIVNTVERYTESFTGSNCSEISELSLLRAQYGTNLFQSRPLPSIFR